MGLYSPETNILSTVLQLPPGTHHVKFIVDGEMQLSNELPTAVDYTNILVNYIEVSADDLPKDLSEDVVPDGVHPPQVLAPGTEAKDYAPDSVGKPQHLEGEKATEPVFWGNGMPRYLLDLDRPEQSQKSTCCPKCYGVCYAPGLAALPGKIHIEWNDSDEGRQ